MNPTPQATSPRGARPQLFGTPSRGKGQPDFGPSILATIDAGSSRSMKRRAASPGRRTWLMALFLLMAAAAYVAMRFSLAPAPVRVAAAQPVAPATAAREAPAAVAPVPALSSTTAPAPSPGAAAIETVPAPAAASAAVPSAALQTASVSPRSDGIRETLARAEPALPKPTPPPAPTPTSSNPPTAAPRAVAQRQAPAVRVDRVEPVKLRGATAGARSPARVERDEDAALLAAMLPHLRSTIEGPTSPAFEKRCGALNGDALAECRIKFCNGRQGDDLACPSAESGRR